LKRRTRAAGAACCGHRARGRWRGVGGSAGAGRTGRGKEQVHRTHPTTLRPGARRRPGWDRPPRCRAVPEVQEEGVQASGDHLAIQDEPTLRLCRSSRPTSCWSEPGLRPVHHEVLGRGSPAERMWPLLCSGWWPGGRRCPAPAAAPAGAICERFWLQWASRISTCTPRPAARRRALVQLQEGRPSYSWVL